jgi:hypothetical protein
MDVSGISTIARAARDGQQATPAIGIPSWPGMLNGIGKRGSALKAKVGEPW